MLLQDEPRKSYTVWKKPLKKTLLCLILFMGNVQSRLKEDQSWPGYRGGEGEWTIMSMGLLFGGDETF